LANACAVPGVGDRSLPGELLAFEPVPTPATCQWPRPKSPDEWEDMVCDAMTIIWSDPNAKRYGRTGQKQNGCDVYGKTDGGVVVAQAKNMDCLSKEDALKEITMAESYPTALQEMHFAISGKRDTRFSDFIKAESEKRKKQGRFSLQVWFFDDLVQKMAGFPNLEHKYLSAFIRSPHAYDHADIQELKNRLAALEEQLRSRDNTPVSEEPSVVRKEALASHDGCWRFLIAIKQAQLAEGGNTPADKKFIVDQKIVAPDASVECPLQMPTQDPLPSAEPVGLNELGDVLKRLISIGDSCIRERFGNSEKPNMLVVLSLQNQLIESMEWISWLNERKDYLSPPPIAIASLCRQSQGSDVASEWLDAGRFSSGHSADICKIMDDQDKCLRDLHWLLVDDRANQSAACTCKPLTDLDKADKLADLRKFFQHHHALLLRWENNSREHWSRIRKILRMGIPLFLLEFVDSESSFDGPIASIFDWNCHQLVPNYCQSHSRYESEEDRRLVDSSYLFWEDHRYKPLKITSPLNPDLFNPFTA
jgi:hypothetical protein